MAPTSKPRIKICCIASVDEAELAIRYGASAIGLVSAMPSGPGPIDEDLIAGIARAVPPPIATFLLTSAQDIESIITQQRRCGTNTIQICDHLLDGSHQDLHTALPGVKIVQVVHVRGEESIDEARKVARHVDAVLLDSGNQKLAVKELGGTGRTHDWNVSREIRKQLKIPVFLAGGLNAENVADAVSEVGPWGIDLCSGVRTGGRLDEGKLATLFASIHTAPISD